ncbi:hypothetical protein GGI25_004988 [Coemansia spiralis]|uniref:DNRLRE domain-containing protein n=2 Tax=Coemansia TaxID=4863 RepID=A0A9W8G3E9_9FUNG|nr:hypothetical protein BX070DRAFT_234363 [Coemansia spiralis]KAJ1989197.1 hypothetical protein EDC05_004853 [Coemansia umbellata]KAJ2620151.1 hypothetical protein GGI26_005266 [Coemansia sp. RSA 1358]KAJ2672670.1 hypothetical protein GGI25_004988 [Coemansia spiralis]
MKFAVPSIVLAALAITAFGASIPGRGVATSTVRTNTAADSTISYSTAKNKDGSLSALNHRGGESTLITSGENNDHELILLGFNLPGQVKDTSLITKCILHVPAPKKSPNKDYKLAAYTASSNWEESTVNGATRITISQAAGSTNVQKGHNPSNIDATSACRAASEGKFSMFINTSGPKVEFNSRSSGKQSFYIDITYTQAAKS